MREERMKGFFAEFALSGMRLLGFMTRLLRLRLAMTKREGLAKTKGGRARNDIASVHRNEAASSPSFPS